MIYNHIENIIGSGNLLRSSVSTSYIFDFIERFSIKSFTESFNSTRCSFDNIVILSLLSLFAFVIFFFIGWNLLKLLKQGSSGRTSRKSSAFTAFAVLVFTCGIILYYIGYDYAGTDKNAFTLLIRSVLSSFEMFLSKSNLLGIADNCKNSEKYMLWFAIIHASALTVSTLFAVLCFGRRILYWYRGIKWRFIGTSAVTNVFWGLNERSFVLAHDISENGETNERFIFVDFPLHEESPSKGQSFSGIFGLFSYKINALRKISKLNCILMRSSLRPSNAQDDADIFDAMNIYRLKDILDKSKGVRFFILTENEDANLKAAIKMLKYYKDEDIELKIYCSARKNMLNRLIEEKWNDRLKLIDDSRAAVTQLKIEQENAQHPIDFVDINKDKGYVTSKFKALIVGFGSTGQDALRFLYEYSAFPDENGEKSPVELHVIDNNMSVVKGAFCQEVPAMNLLENKEIFFHNLSAGSAEFNKFLNTNIEQMNYVVVAVGSDETNMDIASMIMDKALLYRTKKISHFKVFVRMYSDDSIVKYDTAVNVYNDFCSESNHKPLEYFGNTREIYSYNIIVKNHYEQQAIAFYNSYCKAVGDNTTWDDRRKKEVMKLGQIYGKRSLRRKEGQDKANCLHCYTKKVLLNLVERQVTLTLPKWEFIADKEKRQQEPWLISLYNVSICEHLRWNASHMMLGYIPITEEVEKLISGSCDEVTKQHSCIVDWNELKRDIQGYDYEVVKTTVMMEQ